MSSDRIPFGEDLYTLRSCALQRLCGKDADPAGNALAAMDPWRTLGYSARGLSRYLLRHDPALNRFRVVLSEESAGVVAIRYPWLLGPYIELLALYGPYQSSGIGKEILQWVESRVRSTSGNLWALVSSFNTPGQEFYRKAGFVAVAPLEDLVCPGHAEILLRKRFSSEPAR